MVGLRSWFLIAALAGMLSPAFGQQAAGQTTPLPKSRPAVTAKTDKVLSDTRVYLLRGLLNIFSLGMDELADKLKQRGMKAEVYNHDSWQTVAIEIIDIYKRGEKPPIVVIGHSLGADALFGLTERLSSVNVPVALAVPYDPTVSHEATKNVAYLMNFYQNNGFGRTVVPGPGFRGELKNIDLTKDESIGHGSIDKSARLHDITIAKIMEIAGKSKPQRKPRKPATPETAKTNVATPPEPASPRS